MYFPYWDEEGTLTFWMGRAMKTVIEPKTIEPDNASKPLYGRHVTKLSGILPPLLVEGVFDHFVTPSSYALMGSGITGSQIATLRLDGVRTVALLQDPDASESMKMNSKKMGKFGIKSHMVMLSGDKDPAMIGANKMADIVTHIQSEIAKKMLITTIHISV